MYSFPKSYINPIYHYYYIISYTIHSSIHPSRVTDLTLTYTPTDNFKFLIPLTCMFLDCVRKPENLRRREHAKLHTERRERQSIISIVCLLDRKWAKVLKSFPCGKNLGRNFMIRVEKKWVLRLHQLVLCNLREILGQKKNKTETKTTAERSPEGITPCCLSGLFFFPFLFYSPRFSDVCYF